MCYWTLPWGLKAPTLLRILICLPVRRSALEDVAKSGVGARDGGGDCENCDGGCVPAGGGVRPDRGPGCGGGVRGAGTRVEELAGAGEGVNACDGGHLALAVMTSSPSCDPWSSCCRWQWHQGGVKVQPSASENTKWTPVGLCKYVCTCSPLSARWLRNREQVHVLTVTWQTAP